MLEQGFEIRNQNESKGVAEGRKSLENRQV